MARYVHSLGYSVHGKYPKKQQGIETAFCPSCKKCNIMDYFTDGPFPMKKKRTECEFCGYKLQTISEEK